MRYARYRAIDKKPNERRPDLVTEWTPELTQKLKEHIDKGGSVVSFSGPGNISNTRWQRMKNEIPEVIELNKYYKSKLRQKYGP